MSGKVIIYLLMQRVESQGCRTLIERTFWRIENLSHQTTLTTGEYKVGIRNKLDMGTQQSLYACLWVFRDLLKLVNGNIYLTFAQAQIVENTFQRHC